ncbi:MAG: HAMP domain-containing histidine kinase [Deltaproteobacteria bacterium]|nr:HAMP domain-containing histidine kinase [Deltaproteobacteria bacterium]
MFSRLTIGFLVVLALVSGVSLYALQTLHRFDRITRSILENEIRVGDYEKKLSDSLLSEIRYERKFMISKEEALYREFQKFAGDFKSDIDKALAVADRGASKILNEIKRGHDDYQEIIEKERVHIKARQNYPHAWYKAEKDKVTDEMFAALERVKSYRQMDTYRKIRQLADVGAQAWQTALIIVSASLLFILLLSLVITRSVTKPIGALKQKTREISEGKFEGNLRISSPPELRDLAASFNSMCHKLNDLEKMKADFYASMSHELRTPLTCIKEGTGLLLEGVAGSTTEKQRRLLTIVAEESNRLISLVTSLLDLSKMEAGMMTYGLEKCALAPLVSKAVDEIGPLMEAKQIAIETQVAAELPPVKIDRERILQVLRNLLGNAAKFTPRAGKVKVVARSVNDGVEVSVWDNGPGIATDSLDAIFDKFQQGKSNGGSGTNGTGLGLAIANQIIASHGGKIWAENQPERGSTFYFVLPS